MAPTSGTGKVVCVTGAGGFVASWLVKLLLAEGYTVRGTVRDPRDKKNDHLKRFENAAENLQLFAADLRDYGSLLVAMAGSEGVFHTASPVLVGELTDPENEMVAPAVDGTLNVLKACSETKVGRVVLVSSTLAVSQNPNWPEGKFMDETCWTDKEFSKNRGDWYSFAKTVAEEKAMEYGREAGLDVVPVCPSLVLGPTLQPTVNTSSSDIIGILKGFLDQIEKKVFYLVDVRDVADALLLVYQKPEATGRYICCSHPTTTQKFVDKLRSLYPNFKYPTRFTEVGKVDYKMTAEKLRKLGWKENKTLDESIIDTVEHFIKSGYLDES